MKARTIRLLLFLAASLGSAAPGLAQPGNNPKPLTTAEAVTAICEKVATHLKNAKQTSVQVNLPGVKKGIYSAQGMQQLLTDGLKAQGIKSDDAAAFNLQTSLNLTTRPPQHLVITADLLDPDGVPVTFIVRGKEGEQTTSTKLKEPVEELASNAQAQGLLGEIPVSTTDDPLKYLQDQVGQGFFRDPIEHWVMTSRTSDYAVRLVDSQGKPYPVTDKGRKPFVALPEGGQYRIELRNRLGYEAAAEATIDGLSVFIFADNDFKNAQTGHPTFRHYIIPPNQSATISGWFVNLERQDAFEVSKFPASAAASFNHRQEAVGVITVSFSAAWAPGANPPENEDLGDGGTKRGPPLKVKSKPVERRIGKVRTVLTLYYDLSS